MCAWALIINSWENEALSENSGADKAVPLAQST